MYNKKTFSLIGEDAELAAWLKAKGYAYCLIFDSGEPSPLFAKTANCVASVLMDYPNGRVAVSRI
jgi:hypothetical protein